MQRSTLTVATAGALAATLMTACTTVPPLREFELVDAQAVSHIGSVDPDKRLLSVTVGGRHYEGFYVQGSETVSSFNWPAPYWHWRVHPFYAMPPAGPVEQRTVVLSNLARAHLRSDDGGHLACEFLLDGARAAGMCRQPDGTSYQFVAGR